MLRKRPIKNIVQVDYPRVSPGAHPLAKKPEDSGYEIGTVLNCLPSTKYLSNCFAITLKHNLHEDTLAVSGKTGHWREMDLEHNGEELVTGAMQ